MVLGTFSERLTRYLAELANAEPAVHWSSLQSEAYVAGDALTVATFRIGAPATIAAMEDMIACGMRILITTGSAGSLQPTARIGTVVVPTSGIREEGMSHHYAPRHVSATPDVELAGELLREVPHGSGDEHQEGGPKQSPEARIRGAAGPFSPAANLVAFSDLARTTHRHDPKRDQFGNNPEPWWRRSGRQTSTRMASQVRVLPSVPQASLRPAGSFGATIAAP